MALKVKHVGQYARTRPPSRPASRRTTSSPSFDGRSDLLRETDLLPTESPNTLPGDSVKVKILRGGKPPELTLGPAEVASVVLFQARQRLARKSQPATLADPPPQLVEIRPPGRRSSVGRATDFNP